MVGEIMKCGKEKLKGGLDFKKDHVGFFKMK